MKVPIPDDWDGLNWASWSVCWPDSPDWNAILQNFLTTPALGYFWDGNTGSIVDVQETGYEISADNVPLWGSLMRCDEGLTDLIDAINGLKTTGGNVACGCAGGTIQGSTNGTEGGVPPLNFVEPPTPSGTPEYDTRKCKIANLNHQQVVEWLDSWVVNGVDSYIGRGVLGAAAFVLLTTTLGTLVGELATPFPFIDALAGGVVAFIASIAVVIIAQSFDLSVLIALMNAQEQALVCAFHNATSAQQAQDDYIQVLDDAGAAAGALLLLQAIFSIDTLNALFFGSEANPDLEDALDGYTSPIDCANCGCAGWEIYVGTLSSGSLTDGNPFEIDAVYTTAGGCPRYQVHISMTSLNCVYDVDHFAPGIISTACSGIAYWYVDENKDLYTFPVYTPETVCMSRNVAANGLLVRGSNPYTLHVSYNVGCP